MTDDYQDTAYRSDAIPALPPGGHPDMDKAFQRLPWGQVRKTNPQSLTARSGWTRLMFVESVESHKGSVYMLKIGRGKTLWLLAIPGLVASCGGPLSGGIWWFLDNALMLLDAFFHSLGRDTGFVKDAEGQDLNYGLSLWRIKNGQIVRDWF